MSARIVMALVVVTLASAGVAHAQATAQAEQAFRDGKALMERRQYAAACAAFATSDRIEPSIAAKMKQADCEEKRGKLASAWGLFLQVTTLTRDDRQRQAEHQVATARALALEPRLPYLTISVPEGSRVDGLAIERNGEAVDAGLWNRAVPIDVGTYTVTARAPGLRPWSTTVEVSGEGEQRSIDVPRFEPVAVATTTATTTSDDEGAPPQLRSGRSRTVPMVVAGAAVALGGVALGLELSARGRYDDALASQDAVARDGLYDSAVLRRRLAIGAGIGAAATLGVAGWLWWRGRASSTAPTVSVHASGGSMTVAIGGAL